MAMDNSQESLDEKLLPTLKEKYARRSNLDRCLNRLIPVIQAGECLPRDKNPPILLARLKFPLSNPGLSIRGSARPANLPQRFDQSQAVFYAELIQSGDNLSGISRPVKTQPIKMKFTKMHGAGNDYIYLDCFHSPAPDNLPSLARQLSDRHTGIGGDGLILIHPSNVADARMQMFNADGSEAEMCGNGIRCVAKYVYDHKLSTNPNPKIETGAGILSLELLIEQEKVQQVRVDMGPPRLSPGEIPTGLQSHAGPQEGILDQPLVVEGRKFRVTCVSMGNPHCVIFVESLNDELVKHWGPKIECHPLFPACTNVEFVVVESPRTVRQRTWERGSGETLACGTGASAVCVAGVLTGRTERKIVNHLLGGSLVLEWDSASNHVFKTGPALEVFQGLWEPR
jgi:diaminopimelate epimerase